ncbi:MAG: aspartate aminotransferase family protein [Flavobacteriales bacterium]
MEVNDAFFSSGLAQTTWYPSGIEIVSAKGIYLYDENGKRYTDLISGVGVSSLGHSNDYITKALHLQIDKHLHVQVYGEFIQDAQRRAANALISFLPSSLNCCYFVNSGTEAIEAAMKLAKRITGRQNIIAFEGAYHGNTQGSMSISANEWRKQAFRPLLPGVKFIRLNETDDLDKIDSTTAAVFLETVQGDAGVRIPLREFMQALRSKCDDSGALLVLDEIQCGVGRTGRFCAFEHFGIVPDILVLGKALGGGLPVGCLVTSRNNMAAFASQPMLGHISTFAGHPLVCAAVDAGLNYIKDYQVIDEVETKGLLIAERLRNMKGVMAVRQIGLYIAVDITDAETVSSIIEKCLKEGIIIFRFLSCPASFRIAPPLIMTVQEIHESLDTLEFCLNAI